MEIEKKNILIIKLGAMGDVIRTTPFLHVLKENIFWVTRKEAMPLLPKEYINSIVEIQDANNLSEVFFDLIVCLDDEYEAASLSTSLKKDVLIGSYINENGNLTYTESSAEWFDMGLISRFGKNKADNIKMNNDKTYQEILFKMIGKEFKSQEYILNMNGITDNQNEKDRIRVGIEKRAGDRWPMKQWNKYDELSLLLKKQGYEVVFFEQRSHVTEYINDINDCDMIVCGDTLALHIALALRKRIVAIFTCTSLAEIYDYGRLQKVVSPFLNQAFYKREYIFEAVDMISLDEVYSAVEKGLEGIR
jgi:heptosyltransferase-2